MIRKVNGTNKKERRVRRVKDLDEEIMETDKLIDKDIEKMSKLESDIKDLKSKVNILLEKKFNRRENGLRRAQKNSREARRDNRKSEEATGDPGGI